MAQTNVKPVVKANVVTPKPQGNVQFLTVAEFKEQIGGGKLEVVKNPNTGKLFMTNGTENYKVQGSLDIELPMTVLVPDNDLAQACLINGGGNNTLITL